MTEPPARDPDVLTTAELAARLALSPQTVRRMANAGQLPALKTGKDFRYSWEAVRQCLRRPWDDPEAGDGPKKGAGGQAQRRARAGAARHTE
ncbi:Helix-turn-helix domain protein [Actinomadura rubteroloni]|uniref:Helix-turn-helix domain protein n=1 Tax=Actinomadura rubteroloni TaxID=1926885 RepID=A0A2P4UM42_9ACTN|nr:helix-turn-helix domain-containing protein [Actinomadura rubteroloni]POM26117.1 Helix-turn-helix domain protein [Actinomadura rubteroloni]